MFYSYFKFLITSTNQHGVHSPFVFDFVTKGLYKNKIKNNLIKIEKIRYQWSKNNNKIFIEDFGAGSKIFKNNQRTIKQLAKHVALSPKKAKILFSIINYFKPKNVLELGTSLGLGTTTIALANHDALITTVEGCSQIHLEALTLFKQNQLNNINALHHTFDEFLEKNNQLYDTVLFDGHHTYEATIKYFEKLLPAKHNDSFWIFDDIHWSKEMENAWEYIKNHHEVTVSIDLFHYGLVFFRREQKKQHFIIRA